MKNENEEGRAWFTILAGLPATIAWAAYGVGWLLAPRLSFPVDPLAWAGCAAGAYYAIAWSVIAAPAFLAGE